MEAEKREKEEAERQEEKAAEFREAHKNFVNWGINNGTSIYGEYHYFENNVLTIGIDGGGRREIPYKKLDAASKKRLNNIRAAKRKAEIQRRREEAAEFR